MSIGTKHLEQILALADQLQHQLERLPPAKNDTALQRIRALCAQMRCADPYINEKTRCIERKASQYLSAKPATPPFALRDDITNDLLKRIRDQVATLRARTKD